MEDALARAVAGSYPSWRVEFEDGGDGDFDDIIIGVEAIPAGGGSLALSCDPATVERGGTVTCTASVPAGSTLEVSRWSFAGEEGLTAKEETTEATWRGPSLPCRGASATWGR